MRQLFRLLLLALVLMMVALVSALMAMQMAIHGREVSIPKLLGLSPSEAERVAASSGVQLVVERQFYSAQVPEGRIMTQMPLPGAKVRRGWSVRVAQSLGPQRVSIPDVTGESERAAELNIRRRALSVGSIAEVSFPESVSNPLPNSPLDRVVSQSPPANASGIAAPKINLLVSTGTEPAAYVMPDLTGQPLGSATLALQDAGMRVGKINVVTSSPTDDSQLAFVAEAEPSAASMIMKQTPAAGQKIVAGTTVTFEVH